MFGGYVRLRLVRSDPLKTGALAAKCCLVRLTSPRCKRRLAAQCVHTAAFTLPSTDRPDDADSDISGKRKLDPLIDDNHWSPQKKHRTCPNSSKELIG